MWRGNGRTRGSTVEREEKRNEHGTQDIIMVADQLAEVTDVQIDNEVAVLQVSINGETHATVTVPDRCVQ